MPRPLSDDARHRMLDATRAVIADVGPGGLTIDEVARRSGVAKTTIYRHFPNATALVLAALADVPASVVPPDMGNLEDDLRAIIEQFLAIAADGTVRSMMIHALSASADDPELDRLHQQLRQGRQHPIHRALERAQQRGEIVPAMNLDLVASVIDGPFIARRLVADQPITTQETHAMLDLILNGITTTATISDTSAPTLTSRTINTPIGPLTLFASATGLRAITHDHVPDERRRVGIGNEAIRAGASPILDLTECQITEYFDGARLDFDLPLDPQGTEFQQSVWTTLRTIPSGTTRTYREQATALGRPSAVRAVASADGKNPLALVVPCHRVIGSSGSLTGYAWGVDTKRWLLRHEGVAV